MYFSFLFIFFISNFHSLNIVSFGAVGSGKSTVLNKIVGKEIFKSGKSPSSVTTRVNKHTFFDCYNEINLYDIPGIGDPDIPLTKWMN